MIDGSCDKKIVVSGRLFREKKQLYLASGITSHILSLGFSKIEKRRGKWHIKALPTTTNRH